MHAKGSDAFLIKSSLFCLALLMLPAQGMAGKPASAKLVIKGDTTCWIKNGTDHQVNTTVLPIQIPEQDGPVSSLGQYDMTGTMSGGYALSGKAVYRGRVEDDALILTFGQWHYQGKALNNSSSHMPTSVNPDRIPLEPGATLTKPVNDQGPAGTRCKGTVSYKLDMQPETQTWSIVLNGDRELTYHEFVLVLPDGGKQYTTHDYDHGAVFKYRLSARVTLTKKKGKWIYTAGEITGSAVEYKYFTTTDLYTINKVSCEKCSAIENLKGKPVAGQSDGKSLVLAWPNIQPVVVVTSQLKSGTKCAPGETYKTCMRQLEPGSTGLGISDDDFMQRLGGHTLPLKNGAYTPPAETKSKKLQKGASSLVLNYRYKIKRVD